MGEKEEVEAEEEEEGGAEEEAEEEEARTLIAIRDEFITFTFNPAV